MRNFIYFLIALLAFGLVPAKPAQAANLPGGFVEQIITSSLNNPTAMAIAPDGRIFVTQQNGALRVIKNDTLLPTPFLTVNVNDDGERGLLGVAFDPNFASNRYIYIYYTATSPNIHNRVSRFTANGDVAAGGETILMDLQPLTSATNHNGGALHFGPDGKLYIAVGDNADGANAQTLSNLKGKILRINKDGSIPSDNPFYNQTTGINRAIWALGLRNPFTFTFQPGTNRMFINDVGENSWEEINEGVKGANYGWPSTEGYTGNPNYRSPVFAYGHQATSNPSGCSIVGAAFYNPENERFPEEYHGKYFFADYCGGWIRYMNPSVPGSSTFFGDGFTDLVDLNISDDGFLYYLSRGTGTLGRIDLPSTQEPIINRQPSGIKVADDQPATFTVIASGATPLSYQWQRNGSNISGATSPSYTLPVADLNDDSASFRVIISNSYGTTTSVSVVLRVVEGQPPVATILTPAQGTQYQAGQTISFSGSATDPDDGTLPASAFTWEVIFHHAEHTHPSMPALAGVRNGRFTIGRLGHPETNVWYRVYLTVTDSSGLSTQTYRDIFPRLSTITILTNPPGLGFELDGQYFNAPEAVEGVVGVTRTVEAVTPQTINGIQWAFSAWSDGGRIAHAFNIPAAERTLTARYRVLNNTAQNRTPTFVWNAVTGATAYQIQIDDDSAFGSPNQQSTVNGSTTYTAASLNDGAYSWRVRSTSPTQGLWVVGERFIVDNLPTDAPTLITPADNETAITNRPVFRWQPVDDAAQYEMRLEANDSTPDNIVFSGAARQYVPPSPLLATIYYWDVRTIDAAGNVSEWSETFSLNLETPARSVPVVSGFNANPVILRWTEVSWASGYEVQIDNNANFSSPEFSDTDLAVNEQSVSVTLPDGVWYWRVRAKRPDGRPANWSQAQTFVVDVP